MHGNNTRNSYLPKFPNPKTDWCKRTIYYRGIRKLMTCKRFLARHEINKNPIKNNKINPSSSVNWDSGTKLTSVANIQPSWPNKVSCITDVNPNFVSLKWYRSLWLWRWLPHRLSEHQSLSTSTVLSEGLPSPWRSYSTYWWNDLWAYWSEN